MLGGRTPREVLLAVNGWPNLLVGLAVTGFGLALLPRVGTDLSRWRYSERIVVACSRSEVVVRNDTGGGLHLRLNDVAVVTDVDPDGTRSVHPIEPFGHGTPLLFSLGAGESARVPLSFPTSLGRCRYNDCRTLRVDYDASGEGPIPDTWQIGPRDVMTIVDCELP